MYWNSAEAFSYTNLTPSYYSQVYQDEDAGPLAGSGGRVSNLPPNYSEARNHNNQISTTCYLWKQLI